MKSRTTKVDLISGRIRKHQMMRPSTEQTPTTTVGLMECATISPMHAHVKPRDTNLMPRKTTKKGDQKHSANDPTPSL